MSALLTRFATDQRGAAAMEYGLIAALIVLVIVGGMTSTGTSVGDLYQAALGFISGALAA